MTSNHVSFSVSIERYSEFFKKFFITQRQECINPNCDKTKSAVKHIWEANTLTYKHSDNQPALNETTILVNGEQYNVQSYYCCECFKKILKQEVKKERSARQRANQEKREQINQARYRLERDLRIQEEKVKTQTNTKFL